MITSDLKALLRKLNQHCTRALEASAGFCISRTHYEVTIEHLLYKFLEDGSGDIPCIVNHFDVDQGRLQEGLLKTLEGFRTGNSGRPVFSPLLMETIERAWVLASVEYLAPKIRSGIILAAFMARQDSPISFYYPGLLDRIQLSELKTYFDEISVDSTEAPPPESTAATLSTGAPGPISSDSALGRFTLDFTGQARTDAIDPVFGRDREIREMVDILGRRRKNNPIVVGEAGVGKTAIVEGLALRVIQGDVPEILKGVEIRGLDMGLLQAGASVKGEFENRLKSVIDEVKASATPLILFIDEAHMLIGAGGSAGGSDAANLLKPALARGELRTIAATTWSEYKKYFEKDVALARRFQLIKLEEPTSEGTIDILRGLRDKYEKAHGVHILDEAVVAAARFSDRYISGRQLPDKAVDLIDTAAARVKIGLTSKPAVLDDLERQIETRERELTSRQRDSEKDGNELDDLRTNIREMKKKAEELTGRWEKEREMVERVISLRKKVEGSIETPEPIDLESLKQEQNDAQESLKDLQKEGILIHTEVNTEVIAQVVKDWTGIPVTKMVSDEAQALMDFERRMGERIKGQEYALNIISQVIRSAKAGLQPPEIPIGVFLLVGPSGVGKTETGLTVADQLFGGERFMVTINMSEFQEKHTVSRLIGSPPGYVGYGEGGVLTEAVRQRPYSVVLLDEVEKADPEVMNLFYQVFDKGMLSDGEGRIIDFKNTIIFLTSNLASDIITAHCAPGAQRPSPDDLIKAIRPVLRNHFKPALLARMTIVPFFPISSEIMREIAVLKLDHLGRRLQENQKIRFEYGSSVVKQMVDRCIEVETGARNIDHIMRATLMPQISSKILENMMEGGVTFASLKVDTDADGGLCYKFA